MVGGKCKFGYLVEGQIYSERPTRESEIIRLPS